MSEWISVKDRLPEDVSSYLVSRPDLDPPFEMSLWEGGEWWSDMELTKIDGVAHWMTLPPLPEPQLTVKEALREAIGIIEIIYEDCGGSDSILRQRGIPVQLALLPRLRAALEAE